MVPGTNANFPNGAWHQNDNSACAVCRKTMKAIIRLPA